MPPACRVVVARDGTVCFVVEARSTVAKQSLGHVRGSAEHVFEQAAYWLQKQGFSLGLTVPQALLRKDYGWSREVRHQYLGSRHDLELYGNRAGAILALSHVLSTTDLHVENLVAKRCFDWILIKF